MAKAREHLRQHGVKEAGLAFLFATSAIFLWQAAFPNFDPSRWAHHADHLAMLFVHIIGGTFMLLAGAVALRIGRGTGSAGTSRRVTSILRAGR